MANGLFTTPAQVRAAQMAQLQQQGASGLGGSLFALGSTAGDAFQRGLFGTDTRSPEEMRAIEIQSLTQEMNPLNQDSLLQSINNLANAGFQSEAFQLFGMLPQAGKVERSFQDIFDPNTGITNKHLFVDGIDQGPVGIDAPKAAPKITLRNFFNSETGTIDTHQVVDGKKGKFVGVAEPAKDESPVWQQSGERERKNGEIVSTRFNPKEQGPSAYQMLIDTKDGPRWVTAEAGLRRSIERTQNVPISAEGSVAGQRRVRDMILTDPDLGGFFKGLTGSEVKKLSARINDHAEKLARDDRTLSIAEARDKAFLIAKEQWVKDKTFFGIAYDIDLKTPKELQQEAQDDGFKVVQ